MERPLPVYPECAVCGDPAVNPATLAVRWSWNEETRRVGGTFMPSHLHAGYLGTLHGGILSALFDECLAWVSAVERGRYCMTGELTVRFKAPALLGERMELTGWTLEGWGRYLRAAGEAKSASGVVTATASATSVGLVIACGVRITSRPSTP